MNACSLATFVLALSLVAPTTVTAQGTAARAKPGESLTINKSSVWFYSEPGVRDSELTRADLRSNRDRIIVTGSKVVSGSLWYEVRIGCDCLIAPKRPSLGKMPDTHGWLRGSDVSPASKATSAAPAPKPASNLRLSTRETYRSEAQDYLRKCNGQPDHTARIRELQRKVEATIIAGGTDWMEASEDDRKH